MQSEDTGVRDLERDGPDKLYRASVDEMRMQPDELDAQDFPSDLDSMRSAERQRLPLARHQPLAGFDQRSSVGDVDDAQRLRRIQRRRRQAWNFRCVKSAKRAAIPDLGFDRHSSTQ